MTRWTMSLWLGNGLLSTTQGPHPARGIHNWDTILILYPGACVTFNRMTRGCEPGQDALCLYSLHLLPCFASYARLPFPLPTLVPQGCVQGSACLCPRERACKSHQGLCAESPPRGSSLLGPQAEQRPPVRALCRDPDPWGRAPPYTVGRLIPQAAAWNLTSAQVRGRWTWSLGSSRLLNWASKGGSP